MMNEFGVPMNDAEINMLPNPGKAILEQQLATSGMEMSIWNVVAPLVGAAVGIWGTSKSASAAKDQAKAQNQATDAQHGYDVAAWEMAADKLRAEHDQASQNVLLQAQNERTLADYKDATALRRYNYDLMIRNQKQQSLEQQYWKSNELYDQQISLNARSAFAGREDELARLEELQAENAFEQQELNIQNLVAVGKAEARGQTGKSVQKSIHSIIAEKGRAQAQMAEAMLGAERNTRSVLSEIARDQEAADLAAWAQKMLDPGELPLPLAPLPTPVASFMLPRALEEFDFGPKPVRGAMRDPGAAAGQVWGTGITSIAASLGTAAAKW